MYWEKSYTSFPSLKSILGVAAQFLLFPLLHTPPYPPPSSPHLPPSTHTHTHTMRVSPENPTAAHTDVLLGSTAAVSEKFTHRPLSTQATVKSQSVGWQEVGDLKLTLPLQLPWLPVSSFTKWRWHGCVCAFEERGLSKILHQIVKYYTK